MENFEQLLNRPAPQEPADIQSADNDLMIDCDVPTKDGVRKAVKQLRYGNNSGIDSIPVEKMKAYINTSVQMTLSSARSERRVKSLQNGKRASS